MRFGNLRIWLEDLDTGTPKVSIPVQTKTADEELVDIKNVHDIEPSDEFTFTLDGVKYKFRFDRVGSAGKNPFKKAVYFDLAQYNTGE